MTEDDDATSRFWAGVDAAAAEVRTWPAWKRGEWREYPGTVPMTTRIHCDTCGRAIDAHDDERHLWRCTWDETRRCMWHTCATCDGREVVKARRKR